MNAYSSQENTDRTLISEYANRSFLEHMAAMLADSSWLSPNILATAILPSDHQHPPTPP